MSDEAFPSLCGKFLIAMPGMGDARFDKAVIYICAHSDEGAMGFIINQTLENPKIPDFLCQLEIITEEERYELPQDALKKDMHSGGPVEPGRGFVLHSADYASDSTVKVSGSTHLTATLEILRAIAIGQGPKSTFIALGYSGWSAGQLEDEIASNGWLIADADEALIFDEKNKTKYTRSLELLGVDEALLSSSSGHA